MDESSIKVIVKASNQQYDDQTIECQADWTIKRLKENLSEVYPSKPKPEDQKLIYSGQLLKDKLILKDILRHYEGVQSQTHTFHLVYTPKTRYTPFNSLSTTTTGQRPTQTAMTNDGLRQRQNIQRTSAATAINQFSPVSTPNSILNVNNGPTVTGNNNCPTSPFMAGSNVPLFGQPGLNEYMLAQQAAMQNWMQQAYIQYMNQYMNLLSIGVRPETVYMQNQTPIVLNSNIGGIPQMPYLPQNFPFMNTNVSPNLSESSNLPNRPIAVDQQNPINNEVSMSPAAQQPQPQPERNQQMQPRFPNIVDDDFQENRDWLDVFYSVSRLMILLTLVYLYSSPLRCLLVFIIGMGIYMYHVTFIQRAQRQQTTEANNNNNNNNNINNNGDQAVRRPANVAEHEEDNQQEQQQELAENSTSQENVQSSSNGTESVPEVQTEQETSSNIAENTDGTSMIAFLKTFFVSFIVSLLPETPPV